MSNPYKILGVPFSSNAQQVRAKYLNLAKRFHPDISDLDVNISAKKMIEINDAYAKIKNYFQFNTVLTRPKGRFTKDEIDELIKRFTSGQSLYKIGRDMKRRQRSIVKHLIRAGLIEEEIIVQAEKKIFKENWILAFSILIMLMVVSPILSIVYISYLFLRGFDKGRF